MCAQAGVSKRISVQRARGRALADVSAEAQWPAWPPGGSMAALRCLGERSTIRVAWRTALPVRATRQHGCAWLRGACVPAHVRRGGRAVAVAQAACGAGGRRGAGARLRGRRRGRAQRRRRHRIRRALALQRRRAPRVHASCLLHAACMHAHGAPGRACARGARRTSWLDIAAALAGKNSHAAEEEWRAAGTGSATSATESPVNQRTRCAGARLVRRLAAGQQELHAAGVTRAQVQDARSQWRPRRAAHLGGVGPSVGRLLACSSVFR